MNIAIIGGGIAGLAMARECRNGGHAVTLYEKHQTLGLDSQSYEVEIGGEICRCDVPSRMFNEQQWPRLFELYKTLGVETEPVIASQSFCKINNEQDETLESFLNVSLPFPPKVNPRQLMASKVRSIIREIRRLTKLGRQDLASGKANGVTFERYLIQNDYAPVFITDFLFPVLSSTVCTCSYDSLKAYPASIMLAALNRITGVSKLLKTKHGTQDVAKRLTDSITEMRLGHQVTKVEEAPSGMRVNFEGPNSEKGSAEHDQVVFATQANQNSRLLASKNDREKKMFESFVYEQVPVVLHRDDSFLPAKQSEWSTFNFVSNQDAAMCTVWSNEFHKAWPPSEPIFQTINPLREPRESLVLHRTILQRPVVNQQSLQGLKLLQQIHEEPNRRTWFCGSYASSGVPLLESGVQSSLTAFEKIQRSAHFVK